MDGFTLDPELLECPMRRMSLRVPAELKTRLSREAGLRAQPMAEICRIALLEYLAALANSRPRRPR